MIGSIVTHYRILAKLGEGGMGVVYEAEDLTLSRRVALKFCPNGREDPRFRALLLQEARSASSLSHPNIAHVYEYVEDPGGDAFLAMELVSGDNLRNILIQRRLSMEETLNVATSVASALGEAHRNGLIHRDIKPSNIQITSTGVVKVLDFGIARAARPPADRTDATMTIEAVAGTPLYMSPEQASGEPLDGRSDLFSLGVVLYECLAGKSPFAGDTVTSVVARLLTFDPPKPSRQNPRSPEHLDAIVLKLLEKDRKNRYASADALLADLRTPHARTRRKMLALGAGGAACVAAVGAWMWIGKRHREPSPAAAPWYRDGVAALHSGSYYRASKALERAVAIDPGFSMAHAYLAEAWYELDYLERAKDELLKAIEGRNTLSTVEGVRLEAIHRTVTGDFKAAAEKYGELANQAASDERVAALLDLGRAQERNQDTKTAMATYREALRLDAQNATAWLRLAALQARTANRNDADQSLDTAENLFQGASNIEGITECLYVRARFARTRPQARELLTKALAASKVTGDDQQQVKLLLLSSNRYLEAGRPADAMDDANRAIEIARTGGVENLASRGLIDLGNALFVNGRTAEALTTIEEALDIARRNREKRSEARALVNLGSIRIQTGNAEQGWHDVQAALAYYREGSYHTEAALALVLLGRASRNHGDYDAARRAFDETLATLKNDGGSLPMALAQEGLASLDELQDLWPQALKKYEDTRRAFEAIENSAGAATNAVNVARLHALLGHPEGAPLTPEAAAADPLGVLEIAVVRERFSEAAAMARRIVETADKNDIETQRAAHLMLGLALARSGAGAAALESCAKAFDLAHTANKPADEAEALLASADAALAAQNRSLAAKYATRARAYFESAKIPEPLWRAGVLLLRSGDSDRAAAADASSALGRLKASWPSEDFHAYLSRPVIKRLHSELLRIDPAAPN